MGGTQLWLSFTCLLPRSIAVRTAWSVAYNAASGSLLCLHFLSVALHSPNSQPKVRRPVPIPVLDRQPREHRARQSSPCQALLRRGLRGEAARGEAIYGTAGVEARSVLREPPSTSRPIRGSILSGGPDGQHVVSLEIPIVCQTRALTCTSAQSSLSSTDLVPYPDATEPAR